MGEVNGQAAVTSSRHKRWHEMTREERRAAAAEYTKRSRAEQGLPAAQAP